MLNWIIFSAASCILIGVGIFSGRIIKNDPNKNKGFLLGAKHIGPFIGAGTLIATGYSGWGVIGSAGTAYLHGTIEILANFFFALAMTLGTLWFAQYMQKNARSKTILTVPEYLAQIHRGTKTEQRLIQFLGGFATVVFLTVYIVSQIRAIGLVASEWLNISHLSASILLLAVVVIFTMQGGLLAVAINNAIMCVGMIISALFICIVMSRYISIPQLLTNLGTIDPEIINPTDAIPYGKSPYHVFLVFIYALLFTITVPYMSIRFLSLEEDVKIHTMALFMAPMGLILSFIPFVGLFMRYIHPALENPDTAMPVFLNTYISPKTGGIITLFILFAMLSTVSSVLQTQAAALTHDMHIFDNRNSFVHDLINRFGVLIIAGVSLWLTFAAPQGMINQIAYIGTGGLIAMFAGPVIVEIWIKGTAKTCIAAMCTGLFTHILLMRYIEAGWIEAPILGCIAGAVVYAVWGTIVNRMQYRLEQQKKGFIVNRSIQ
ncbi:MAG: sodium:solute symporter family protein [Treponema sp.]